MDASIFESPTVAASARGAAGGTCNADGPSAVLSIEQYQPARGRHTNRITGCLTLRSPGNPLIPPQTAVRPPIGFSRIPPVWFHYGYRPVIWPFTLGSQPCNFGRHTAFNCKCCSHKFDLHPTHLLPSNHEQSLKQKQFAFPHLFL
jgi:hypothetical protein